MRRARPGEWERLPPILMLDFYIDDSYTSGGIELDQTGGVFVLAGWISLPRYWDQFELYWKENVIAKAPKPISRLHMSDLENPVDEKRGEFRGWTRDEQNALMSSAVNAVTDARGCPYMMALAQAVDMPKGRKYPITELFATALYHLMFDLFQFSRFPVQGLQLAYEDDNKQFWPHLQNAVTLIRTFVEAHPDPKMQKVFSETGYQPMRPVAAGLQVSDLLAYEVRRRVELHPKPRRSYERLIVGCPHVFRRTVADVDGPLPIVGLPSRTFDARAPRRSRRGEDLA